MNAKLTLVGAGPGDPDLISIKGIKALKQADVVLYDALAHPDLLKYAPTRALKIFVGKRVGCHSYKQEEINRLIVEYALTHGHVVRLKGGDPFIFGRGKEELDYAENFNIETTVIPGISSIAVGGLQQIPLTTRGISQSFWVLTATTRHHQLANDIRIAAQSTATLVILMGTRKLAQIADIFAGLGKAATPVAIIQNGSLPNEKMVMGTMDTIVEQAKTAEIASPAIIIVGEVVRTHPHFNVTTSFNWLVQMNY